MPEIDVMAFGAHPDDIELGCGGTLIKLTEAGRRIVLVDLVRGELGTRGTPKIRRQESEKAAEILGATKRENLELEEGNIHSTPDAKRRVVEAIRRWRPTMLFVPYWQDRHPDHVHTSKLVYEATFLAGLPRFDTGQDNHRPTKLLYYMGWQAFTPSFIVDISEQFERKMAAIQAYATQFVQDASSDPPTRLTAPMTEWLIHSRMGYHGSLIGKRYGEGFLIRGHLEVKDPLELKFSSF